MAHLPAFPRTICACEDCVKCCEKPAYLVPGDIFAIGEHLVRAGRIQNVADVFQFLQASKGAVVGKLTGEVFRIPTIVPKVKDGQCVFLTDDKKCSIHKVAPFGCAYFDPHMDQLEGQGRSFWGLNQINNTPAYEVLRQKLIHDNDGAEKEPLDG